jgi:hypothetical protein
MCFALIWREKTVKKVIFFTVFQIRVCFAGYRCHPRESDTSIPGNEAKRAEGAAICHGFPLFNDPENGPA